MGGGLLIDGGIHYLHLMRAWAGPATRSWRWRPRTRFAGVEGEDTVFLLLRFRSGAVGTLANSIAAPRLPRWQWAWVTGTEGSLGVDHRGRALWLRGRSAARVRVFVRDRRGLVAQLAEFVAAVREGRPPASLRSRPGPIWRWCWPRIASLETGRPARRPTG